MQGKIVEYVEQGRFICALVQEEAGKRLRVVNQNGREMKLPAGRLVHLSQGTASAQGREEIMALLQGVSERRQALMDPIDLAEIWELAVEEEGASFTPKFLTELAFAEAADDDHVAAFLRCVFADRLFFKYREGRVQVHSAEIVEQLRVKAQREHEKEELLAQGAAGLAAIAGGQGDYAWPGRQRCLELVRDFYLFGSEAEEKEVARDLLKRANLGRPHDPYHLLVAAGLWAEHENIVLQQVELPVEFSLEEEGEARRLSEAPADFGENRLDLRHLELLTIDGAATRDLDDALHVEKKGDNFLVGIHIADVSHYIKPDDILFDTARSRATSVYMADQQVPMLPPLLSEGCCSLIAGEERPAISTLVELTPTAEVVDFSIRPSLVKVKRRLTYEEALTMADDWEIATLTDLSQKLIKKRVSDGAVLLPLPDVNVRLKEGRVAVDLMPSDTVSRTLVAEFMVLANRLGAYYVSSRMEPGLFRSQEPPRRRITNGYDHDIYLNFRQRRFLSRGQLLAEARPHSGVGAPEYTTITSPIRRFLDLVMQHQLGRIMRREERFSTKECNGFVSDILRNLGRANRVRYQRQRYWLLTYLAQEVGVGGMVEALILDIQPRRIQVVLTDILLEGDLPLGGQRGGVEPGETVTVRLAKV
ncbi:MAG: ribonuclease catalytic domain-containing protein, partial [Thermodesulfobacteriota bacterium]